MAIGSFKMGPGTLVLDPDDDDMSFSTQITSGIASSTENVDSTDDVWVLSDEQLPGEDTVTYTWQLALNVVQDIAADGTVAYSWANKGLEKPFLFIPSTAAGRQITGTVRIAPISIGGDVKTRPQADITWQGKKGEDFILADVED